jgi:F-type H+-transporting ATPase subunit a
MISGHTLIKILSNFSFTLLQKKDLHLILLGLLPLIVILAVIGLEFTIAFLQVYVFVTLLSIYLNDVIQLH